MYEELIPWIKVSLLMFDFYIFCRIFSREVVRFDVDKGIDIRLNNKGF